MIRLPGALPHARHDGSRSGSRQRCGLLCPICPFAAVSLGWKSGVEYGPPSGFESTYLILRETTMVRSTLPIVCCLLVGFVGCQGRNGRGVHVYGNTRVPPPPTHSYTKPQGYYSGSSPSGTAAASGNSGTQPARFATPSGSGAVGSGVAPLKPAGGIRLQGMPVNDATSLSTPGGPKPRYQPVTNLPAPGLQFIRRTSAEEPVGSGTSSGNELTSHPHSESAPRSAGAAAASTGSASNWQTR